MFDLMQSVLLIFIEMMCCKIFYETFGEVRYKGWINTMQFILLLSCICFLSYGFSEHFVIRQIIGILMFSVFMLWHVRISLKKSFVLAVLFDRVSIGTITALINYQGMLVSPMVFFSQFNNSYQSTLIAINRINSFLSEREEDLGKKAKAEIKIYNIAFKNVYFQYKEGISILENVNLELNSGKIVGFIGDSGSGKSTLAKMFLRLYNPQMGEILINKQNIDQIPIVSLRDKIVYAAQESFFFKGSIIENLELGEKIERESVAILTDRGIAKR